MGVAGGKTSLQIAGVDNCDAITVGTGLGCVRDTLKFMKVMYERTKPVCLLSLSFNQRIIPLLVRLR